MPPEPAHELRLASRRPPKRHNGPLSATNPNLDTVAGFSNTITLHDVRGFDESATEVLLSVASGSGAEFPTSMPIPEPSTAMLLAVGLCGLTLTRARS